MSRLTYEEAHRLFEYAPASGLLTWRVCKGSAKAGSLAGYDNGNGYLRVRVHGKFHRVHRIAFLLMTGDWPGDEIDHINGVRTDNRWNNLRASTHHQNNMNHGKRKDNSSGFKGVYQHKKTHKWCAQIRISGIRYHLGCFSIIEEANACYQGAASLAFGEFNRQF